MTIKEIMKIGTSGMNTAQKMEEQERRIEISVRINRLQEKVVACESEARKVEKGSPAARMLNGRIRKAKKELNRIKADESVWLREAAWFMYA
jgi:hypothetical protein